MNPTCTCGAAFDKMDDLEDHITYMNSSLFDEEEAEQHRPRR